MGRGNVKQGIDSATQTLNCKTVRIFAYSSTREQSNKRSRTRLKQRARLGRDSKNTCFSPASHAPRAYEARALRARKTHTPHFTYFFTDFEKKKTDCFAVYPNAKRLSKTDILNLCFQLFRCNTEY